MSTLHLAHELACAVLLWTCFCRLVRTDENTKASVRFAFWFLSFAAIVSTASPYLGWGGLDWPAVLMLSAAALVQVVTARHWRYGPPPAFQTKENCNEAAG